MFVVFVTVSNLHVHVQFDYMYTFPLTFFFEDTRNAKFIFRWKTEIWAALACDTNHSQMHICTVDYDANIR